MMSPDEILPGDVLMVYGRGFINDAIEFITKGPSHCALFVNNANVAEAQAGMKIGSTPLSTYLKWNNRLEVYRDESLTDDQRNKIVKVAKDQFGEEYDYLAILAELAHFELGIKLEDYHEGKKRICSTFVYDCGLSVGKEWSNTPLPAPVDLMNSGKLKKIGTLK